ncbi:hypothetical protein ACVIGB_000731 [Bradyrhizobium sp. USDA 4341]
MVKISDEQRRVLKMLRKAPRSAKEMRTGVRTLLALSERNLISVPAGLDQGALAKAVVEITEAGLAVLPPPRLPEPLVR